MNITDDVSTLSKVIAIWGWHILAWIFFVNSLVYLVSGIYLWFFVLMSLFCICEVISLMKKWNIDLLHNNKVKGGKNVRTNRSKGSKRF